MPEAASMRFCDDRGAHGFSWVVDEAMTRTSHVLCADGRVWIVDPVDWPEAIERAASLGQPVAVLQLLDRHNRDCAAVAERLGVPHLVVPATVPESPFEVIEIKRSKRWQEIALWWPQESTLLVTEALGTNPFFVVGADLAGVHSFLKLTPPRKLRAYVPQTLLVGHGAGLHGADAATGLRQALGRSRLSFFSWAAALPLKLRRLKRDAKS